MLEHLTFFPLHSEKSKCKYILCVVLQDLSKLNKQWPISVMDLINVLLLLWLPQKKNYQHTTIRLQLIFAWDVNYGLLLDVMRFELLWFPQALYFHR